MGKGIEAKRRTCQYVGLENPLDWRRSRASWAQGCLQGACLAIQGDLRGSQDVERRCLGSQRNGVRTPPPAQGGKEILGTARSDLRDLREEQHGAGGW